MPNSSSCRLNGLFNDAENQEYLKICIVSVPEKGKANKELIAFLSKKIGIPKSQFKIISGEHDRYKKLKIEGDHRELQEKMHQLELEIINDSKNN